MVTAKNMVIDARLNESEGDNFLRELGVESSALLPLSTWAAKVCD